MSFRWLLAAALIAAPMAAVARPATAPASIAARIARIEDQLAIERILVDYAAFLDGRDYAHYAGLFAPDGEWKNAGGSHKGPPAIQQMLERTMGPAGAPNLSNYHIITNPRVDLAGDRATATSRYLFVMRTANGQPMPALAGVYHDEFVRLSGHWKIQRRVADDIMPTPEEWAKIMATHKAGK